MLVSCQKEINYAGTDPVVDHVKDSTLLIKNITFLSDISQDSIDENYSYDSVNRKITLTWNDPSESNFPDGTIAGLSYNDKQINELTFKGLTFNVEGFNV